MEESKDNQSINIKLEYMQKSLDKLCTLVEIIDQNQTTMCIDIEKRKSESLEDARKIMDNHMNEIWKYVRENKKDFESRFRELEKWRNITFGAIGIIAFIIPLIIKYWIN